MYSRRWSIRAGLKKGAHYSAPMVIDRVHLTFRMGLLATLALCGLPGSTAPAAESAADAKKAEAELQAIKSEIERATRQISDEQVEKDRLSKELRSAELSVG